MLVGAEGGRVVATQGDPATPVKRGLTCVKGDFLHGRDRLGQPLLRRRNGVHVQKGLFEEYAAFGRANGQQPYLIPHRVEGCQITKEFNKRPSRHGWPDKA